MYQDVNENQENRNIFCSMTQFDRKEYPKQHTTSRHFVDESSMFDVCFQPEVTESPVSKPKSKFSKNEH